MPRAKATHPVEPRRRSDTIREVAVIAVALGVRLVYLGQSAAAPTFDTPVMDAADYDILARCLLHGGEPSTSLFWQPVFYPLFLTGVYALSGSSILAAKLVQCALGAATCWLTYRLGRQLFSVNIGLIAGLIMAMYGPLVFFEAELLATGWATFWAVTLVLLFLRARQNPHWTIALVLGICGALSVVTRPTFLPFLVVASIWVTCSWARGSGRPPGRPSHSQARRRSTSERELGRHRERRRAAFYAAALILGFVLIALPVAITNHTLNNHFGILPASGGINFYLGNNPDAEATIAYRPGRQWDALSNIPAQHGVEGDVWTVQKFYYERAAAFARNQPVAFLLGLGRKTIEFLSSRELPRSFDVYTFRQWSGLLAALTWKIGGFGFPFGVILPLAAVGLIVHRRCFPAPTWLLLTLYPLAVILVFPAARYRAPLVPLFAVAAAVAGVALVELIRAARWRALLVHAVTIAAIVLGTTLPGPFPTEGTNYAAELHLLLGNRHAREGRTQQAIASFRDGLSSAPDEPDLHARLGELLLREGRSGPASEHLEAALQVRPDSAANHALLGIACEQTGDLTRAVAAYRKSVALDPGFARAWANLGAALLNKGQPAEAVTACREAIRLEPEALPPRYNLALALERAGQRAAALAVLRELLIRDPAYEPARRLMKELQRD